MNYNQAALFYAEKQGIIEYEVINNIMVYYDSFILENATYKVIVNLNTLKETRSKKDEN